jgi:hypothetical protein
MRGHKQDYFIILLATILVIIVFAIVFISFGGKPSSEKKITIPTQIPTVTQADNTQVLYDDAAESRLAQDILHRPQLSSQDAQQKTNTLQTILHGPNSGVLYETSNVRLEYVQSADLFMAEIKTINIVQAKSEIYTWLQGQGFSPQGICNLPVMFYMDPEVRQALEGQKIIFSPLPSSC